MIKAFFLVGFLLLSVQLWCQKDESLFGKWWLVEFHNDSLLPFEDSGFYYVEFSSDNIKLNMSMNSCQSQWEIKNDEIFIAILTCTFACCDDAFSSGLNYSGKYKIEDESGDLVIENQSGFYRFEKE